MQNISYAQQVRYPVAFGTSFKVDGLGFVSKGTLSLSNDGLKIEGRKQWHWFIRLLLYFPFLGILNAIISKVLGTVVGFGVGAFGINDNMVLEIVVMAVTITSLILAALLPFTIFAAFCHRSHAMQLPRSSVRIDGVKGRTVSAVAQINDAKHVKLSWTFQDAESANQFATEFLSENT